MTESMTQIKDTTANPAPLGLLGFGMTTVLLNFHNAGFYELNSMILAMGICYGGTAQIIAGIMEWKKGNTFATTAFISYGFFWLSLVALVLLPKIIPTVAATNETALAIYLSIWGLFTAVMFIGTLPLEPCTAIRLRFADDFVFPAGLWRLHRCQPGFQAFHRLRRIGLRFLRNLHRSGANPERALRQNDPPARPGQKIRSHWA